MMIDPSAILALISRLLEENAQLAKELQAAQADCERLRRETAA